MKKDIKGNIGILAGRNIENHGDIGIEIGFIGDEYYIFGYPCINGGHTTIKELFRIRIDKDRLNKWSEYIDRLSIHIENKNKPIMKNQKFKVGDKVRVKPEYSHENTTEHEVFTISDVEHPCKNVVYFNHDDSLICSCPIEWLEKIDQKEIFTPKHCMGLSEEDAQDAIDTAERMQKTVKETFEFVNRNQPPTPESLSAKLIELTKAGKLKWEIERESPTCRMYKTFAGGFTFVVDRERLIPEFPEEFDYSVICENKLLRIPYSHSDAERLFNVVHEKYISLNSTINDVMNALNSL